MARYSHILFDLDGTLIDSAPAILASFQAAFAASGVTPVRPISNDIIGPPLTETLQLLAGSTDATLIARLSEAFKASYDSSGYQAGFAAARQLLAAHPQLQALFCATDMLALGAQDGLRDTAAPLPAIVGFDDIPQADWQPYQLTTIQQNTALLAHHAVDLLMTRIARFSLPSRHREVPVKLIIRHSAK